MAPRAVSPHRLPFDWTTAPLGVSLGRLGSEGAPCGVGPHTHDYLVALYVESGTGWCQQGLGRWDAEAGSLFLVAPGEVHHAIGLGGCVGWVLSLHLAALGRASRDAMRPRLPVPGDPAWLVLMRPACLTHHLHVAAEDQASWSDRFEALDRELRGRRPGVEHAVSALATLLLIDIGRLAFPGVQVMPIGHQRVIVELFAFIEERFCENISLDAAAHALDRAPESLARLVRRSTGRSVGDWIAERRMLEARRLLLETDESVERVAAHSGYPDLPYFRRRFREFHRCSPHGWRLAQR